MMLNFFKSKFYYLTLLFLISNVQSNDILGQITVTTNRSALQLAQAITGNGVTVTNAVLNCANTGNGIFNSPNNTVGINEGIVLSTGNANQIGNAEPGATSHSFGRNGDADLTAISGTNVTRDACVLEFDVVPVGDELKFDYVFASEEYINAVCGPFNDVFAFFISGPGITGTKNIALVPNTQIPVAVNSVNNGVVGTHQGSTISNCTSMGAGSPFTQYYINNTGNSFFAYRGYTTVFTAKQDVLPCNVYHLKLAIADAGNYLYDSGVFIKSGSLSSTSISASLNAPLNINNKPSAIKGCTNAQININRTQIKSTTQNVSLVYGGTAQANIDYLPLSNSVTIPANATSATLNIPTIATTNRGDRVLKVYVVDPFNCNNTANYVDSIEIQLIEKPTFDLVNVDDTICNGSSVLANIIAHRDVFQYQWSPIVGVSNPNIANAILTPTVTTTFYVNGTIPNSGCAAQKDSVTITVIAGPQNIQFSEREISVCKDESINVSASVSPIIDGLRYSWNGPNGFVSNSKDLNINNIQNNQSGWYKLQVTAEGCSTIQDSIYVRVGGNSKLPNIPDLEVCLYDQPTWQDSERYQWFVQPFGGVAFNRIPEINSNQIGSHTVYVAQESDGCWSDRVPVEIDVIKCCEKDMFVANAFSPNNDGLNDVFEIKFDPGTTLTAFHVYNRWGQRIYTNAGSNIKWDGTLNDQYVDVGVYYYYFKAHCKDGTEIERKGELHVLR